MMDVRWKDTGEWMQMAQDVLIVEDDVDCGRALSRVIKYMGHGGECVTSGQEALEHLRCSRPRLVILDVMMPDMDGMEVLRRIRQNPLMAAVPVVFYSAVGDPSFQAYALAQGASEYWVKASLCFEDLERNVTRYLSGPPA